MPDLKKWTPFIVVVSSIRKLLSKDLLRMEISKCNISTNSSFGRIVGTPYGRNFSGDIKSRWRQPR